ncbi:MAG: hypothetical protein ACO396_09330, partial [Phycisphaerales bacterium]
MNEPDADAAHEGSAPAPDASIPDDLRLDGSPAAAGWRMPAEWSRLDAVWLVRPHNDETWPGCLDLARREWDNFAGRLREVVEVRETASL